MRVSGATATPLLRALKPSSARALTTFRTLPQRQRLLKTSPRSVISTPPRCASYSLQAAPSTTTAATAATPSPSDILKNENTPAPKLRQVAAVPDSATGLVNLHLHSDRVPHEAPLEVPLHWLRDSCTCPTCRDPHSGQRTFPSTDVPDNPELTEARALEDGGLGIVWAPGAPHGAGKHISQWTSAEVADWTPGYNPSLPWQGKLPPLYLWDQQKLDVIVPQLRVTFQEWMAGGQAFWTAVYLLRRTGLCIITGVPESEHSVEQMAAQIGPLQETFYGRTWDVKSKPRAENVAYTSRFLGLHQDLLYLPNTPRLQLLHCLANSCTGGESLFADGFHAAHALAATHPLLYDELRRSEQTFHYDKDGHQYAETRATVVHAEDGSLRRINWSPPFQASSPIPTRASHPYLAAANEARRVWDAEIARVENASQFKLQPGECVVMDNHRILHGRNEFDTTTGQRWLKGCYVSDHVWLEKLHYLRQQVKASPEWFAAAQEPE